MIYPYSTPFGNFTLLLDSEDKSLRPWDASDEYILSHIYDKQNESSKILIVNDNHGALTVPLAARCKRGIQDSLVAATEIRKNLKLNQTDHSGPGHLEIECLPELKEIDADLIIIKVPKSLEYFRLQLRIISSRLKNDCTLIAGGMNKYLPVTFFNVLKEFCPHASYSRIVKKARCYEGTIKAAAECGVKDFPEASDYFTYRDVDYYSYPGVFSFGKLDEGSRFLLDYLHSSEGHSRTLGSLPEKSLIIDPGCGCGVLGLQAVSLSESTDSRTEIKAVLSDDNAIAVAGSRFNARRLGLLEKCSIIQSNILEGMESGTGDMVICNPPFHRGHRVSMETGFAFLRESARVLKEGALALFVVNSSLGYGNLLSENFRTSSVVRENKRYRLILCRR